MKRFGCNRLFIPSEGFITNYVVEIDSMTNNIAYFPLKEEISNTEWIGGIIFLSLYDHIELTENLTIEKLIGRYSVISNQTPLYAWHIFNIDISLNGVVRRENLRLLQ